MVNQFFRMGKLCLFLETHTRPRQLITHSIQLILFILTGLLSTLSYSASRVGGENIIELLVVGEQLTASDGTALTITQDVTAVSLNVTVVSPGASGFITVYPCGVERPLASNLNYVTGDVVPNGVLAAVGSNGKVCLYSLSETDLVVDIAGWFSGDVFVGVTPKRLVDTRDGTGSLMQKVTPASVLTIPVKSIDVETSAGLATSVPTSATAASLNVTVVNPEGSGFLTVYP